MPKKPTQARPQVEQIVYLSLSDKESKNKYRYHEVDENNNPVPAAEAWLESVYIRKDHFTGAPPTAIDVTLKLIG